MIPHRRRHDLHYTCAPKAPSNDSNYGHCGYSGNRPHPYGRCHKPVAPAFYSARSLNVALAEVDADRGAYYSLAAYQIVKPITVMAIGEFDYFWRTGCPFLGHEISKDIEDYEKFLERQDAHVLVVIDAFFADKFMRSAYTELDYRLISAIADVMFSGVSRAHEPVDALVYPSVAFREGLNFAIQPEAYRDKLRLIPEQTRILEITDVVGFGIDGYHSRKQISDVSSSGELFWQEI